jgi:hypothetical protein
MIMKNTVFWDITSCSLLKVNGHFRWTSPPSWRSWNKPSKKLAELCLPPAFTLGSYSTYSSAVKMETLFFSETPVDFERTTWRYIPEDSTLQYYFFIKTAYERNVYRTTIFIIWNIKISRWEQPLMKLVNRKNNGIWICLVVCSVVTFIRVCYIFSKLTQRPVSYAVFKLRIWRASDLCFSYSVDILSFPLLFVHEISLNTYTVQYRAWECKHVSNSVGPQVNVSEIILYQIRYHYLWKYLRRS